MNKHTPSDITGQPVSLATTPHLSSDEALDAEQPVEPPKQPNKVKRIALIMLGLIALGAAAFYGYNWYHTGRFMVETDDAYIRADSALISSRVEGYVAQVLVQENASVKAGQLLLKLEDSDYRIALNTAQVRASAIDHTLQRIDAQIAAAKASVQQVKAEKTADQAQLLNAQIEFKRIKGLTARKVVAQAKLDSATANLDTAKAKIAGADAQIASAQANVAVLQAQKGEEISKKAEYKLAVEQAERNLARTELRAAIDGVATHIVPKLGDLVRPGTRLVAIVPTGKLYIEANFKETQLPGIAPGAEVNFTVDAIPDQEFTGHVTSAAPATGAEFSLLPADNATGNFTKIVQRVPIRIAISQASMATGALRAGLSVVVNVDSRTPSKPAKASTIQSR